MATSRRKATATAAPVQAPTLMDIPPADEQPLAPAAEQPVAEEPPAAAYLVPVSAEAADAAEPMPPARELRTEPEPVSDRPHYRGISEKQAEILCAPFHDDDLDIKPDGAVYLGHAVVRDRLCRAFTPVGWGMRRIGEIRRDANQTGNAVTLFTEWQLWIGDQLASQAWGEQNYFPSNKQMTWGDAIEGAKSNALTRCAKDLGMVLTRRRMNEFIRTCCVRVLAEVGSEIKPQWRRLDAGPFPKETALVKGSPNAAAWLEQMAELGLMQRQKADAKAGAGVKTTDHDLAKPADVKAMWDLAKSYNWDRDELATWIAKTFGVKASAELTNSQLAKVRSYIVDPDGAAHD